MNFALTTTRLSDGTYSAVLNLTDGSAIIGSVAFDSGFKSAKKAEDWAAAQAQDFKSNNTPDATRAEQHIVSTTFSL